MKVSLIPQPHPLNVTIHPKRRPIRAATYERRMSTPEQSQQIRTQFTRESIVEDYVSRFAAVRPA